MTQQKHPKVFISYSWTTHKERVIQIAHDLMRDGIDTIIDEWNYGVNDNYGYSNYYVKSPNNIGSKSSITNLWGTVKSSDSQKYGWAMSSSTKSWNDVRLNAHWNYFKF